MSCNVVTLGLAGDRRSEAQQFTLGLGVRARPRTRLALGYTAQLRRGGMATHARPDQPHDRLLTAGVEVCIACACLLCRVSPERSLAAGATLHRNWSGADRWGEGG